MITVAGVVFSITVVALTLASQQFGPRLLPNFMRDPGDQKHRGRAGRSGDPYCSCMAAAASRSTTSGEARPCVAICRAAPTALNKRPT
jgi:Predicted membrane protein (DUF2254)